MSATLIRRADLAISLWRNGAGRKADIATGAGWLIGYAFLDADAAFSDYAGHDRTITLVDGPGFSLVDAEGKALEVDTLHRPTPFDGGWRVECRIHGAPCMVLNAHTERARWRHSVTVGPAVSAVDPCDAVADVLVVLAGSVTVDGMTAGRHDALRLGGPVGVHASADALVCRISVHAA